MERKQVDINMLLLRLQQGDEKAFRSLFEEFYPSLCLFATHYLGDKDEAADIVQESFLKYWNKRADFDDYRRIKSFLYVVVRHACLNHLRDRNLRLQVSDELIKDTEQDFHDYLMEEEAHRIFNKAIDSLPNQMRAVINYSLDGLKNAEIAEKMNLTEGTVHAYKKEAYKKLKISLRECYYLLSVFVYLFFE
ncbi:RNA polymerase sigma factor [Butyricimonas hominis]|jgi:RNA polymerase sigma-70 factor|uniref:RNA polymerase sigma-70 factor n=1 Tax=Butyricimonas hominis TaxID=2763032 RepID=A0ABR7D4Z7_9BACT|nr:RNA polymerase sigma-70 factor [Butyricimonas hominis]MBC5622827.1 RNA polymerase sigma-70 factor [Butyricimonas hominis]